jgi:hypothetical protein
VWTAVDRVREGAGMTKLQDRTTDGRPVAGSGRPPVEQTVDAVVATADDVLHSLQEGQAAAAEVVGQWAGRLAGAPINALSGGGVRSIMSGELWVDCTFDMVEALLRVQRRSALRLADLQQRTTGLLVESGLALAGSGREALRGTGAAQTGSTAAS